MMLEPYTLQANKLLSDLTEALANIEEDGAYIAEELKEFRYKRCDFEDRLTALLEPIHSLRAEAEMIELTEEKEHVLDEMTEMYVIVDDKLDSYKDILENLEPHVECDECGRLILEDEAVTDNETNLCMSCKDNYYCWCEYHNCGKLVHNCDSQYVDGIVLCNDCFDEATFLCDECNKYHLVENKVGDDNGTELCVDCYKEYYIRCCECGTIIHYDNSYSDGFDHYCEEHIPKDTIHPYDYIPNTFNEWGNSDKYRYLGIELELDKGGECADTAEVLLDMANDLESGYEPVLYAMSDGSLEEGFEIASHPATLEYHINTIPWRDILSEARDRGYRSHDTETCGLHVHMDRRGFGTDFITQEEGIMKAVYIVEKFWDKVIPFSRRTAYKADEWAKSYCSDNSRLVYDEDEHGNLKLSPKKLIETAKGEYAKYRSVNLTHSPSIEIRIFRGTLNYESFIATLQFCNLIFEVAEAYTIDEIMDMTWNDFLMNGKQYKELISYCKRRDIPYVPQGRMTVEEVIKGSYE